MYIKWSFVAIQTKNTLETDRPQRGRPAVCVIAQHYSSATHYRKKKLGAGFKTPFSYFLLSKNCFSLKLRTEESLYKFTEESTCTSTSIMQNFSPLHQYVWGHSVALRYKSEGRGFDSRLCHWFFPLT